jgi:cytosine/adenosine deaminase-related metal-dependent hydrolase
MSAFVRHEARAGKDGGKPTIVSVRELLEFATLQGAKTLGLESKTGPLTPGKRADILVVNSTTSICAQATIRSLPWC